MLISKKMIYTVAMALMIVIQINIVFVNIAFGYNNTLKLILVNRSNDLLIFKGSTGENPNNTFNLYPKFILPHTSTLIIGTTTRDYDLAGELHFQDSSGADDVFTIIDFRQFHAGQPVFSMMNNRFYTIVKSRIKNKETDPTQLMYVAAQVELFSNEK